ncbi:ROK family protein [Kribbella sp. NBC_01245]|uniref:ROK family transcriptional regulator n=1 Tax=Kribbella sp. NBC_01245 TaxID=2903578 RepID=UPI002E2BE1A6|nr:ROK family protein [Kribbella sp. NBC_01245]
MNRAVAGTPSAEVVLRSLLSQTEPRTRSELSVACELSRPTVFGAIERLEALGLAAPLAQRSGLPGRTATLYGVPPAAGCVAGVDIGGTNLRAAVCDLSGTPLAEMRRATRARGAASVVRQAVELLAETRAKAKRTGVPLLAAGVAIPGVVNRHDPMVRYAWNVGQQQPYDFYSQLSESIDGPVLLENNVNLAAIGEHRHGAGRTAETFAVIAIGTGVGAGIMHNGRLLRGAHGAAGEVAFLPTGHADRRGPHDSADEAGGAALLREAQALTSSAKDVADLFEQARRGEQPALSLVEDECRRIGEIVASICAVVDPETVILSGGIGDNDYLVARVAELAADLPVAPAVVRSALGERASLAGAIATAVDHAAGQLLGRVQNVS